MSQRHGTRPACPRSGRSVGCGMRPGRPVPACGTHATTIAGVTTTCSRAEARTAGHRPVTSTEISSCARASLRLTSIPSTFATVSNWVSCPVSSSMLVIAPVCEQCHGVRLLFVTPCLAAQLVELRRWIAPSPAISPPRLPALRSASLRPTPRDAPSALLWWPAAPVPSITSLAASRAGTSVFVPLCPRPACRH